MLKKRWGWIVALVVLIAALVGVLLWLGRTPAQEEASAQPTASAAAYTMLYEESLPDFTRMVVTVKGENPYAVTADLVYNETGELLGVNNSLAQPILLEGQPSFRFGNYAYQMLILAAQHIPVLRQIPRAEAGELAQYGLQQPSITLEMHYGDDKTRTLRIGDLTPTGDGCYVLCDDTDIGVAPYDLYQTLIGGLNGMHMQVTSLGYTAEQVTSLSIRRGDALMEIDQKSATGALIPFEQTVPFVHDVNTERFKQVLSGLCAAVPGAYAGYADTDEAKAAYGLDAPALTFTVVVEGQYLSQLTVGGDAPDGCAYCTIDRSGDVYLLDKEKLAFADEATQEFLLEQAISLVPVSQLQSVSLTRGESSHELALVWGEDKVYAQQYLVDGAEVEREGWTKDYTAILALTFDKVEQGQVAGEPELTLVFSLVDGTEKTVAFYRHDENYDTVAKDGEPRFLIRREKVDSLIVRWFGGQ